jgi:hydroxymethylpyrimidine kinase/phosphomethylpyrimidine kinase
MVSALSIAGSDSGGGAGVQADLKTFAALGVHGTTAITCLTAQNPRRVLGVHPAPAAFVHQQLEAIFSEVPPAAVKTGMLFSAPIIRAVAEFLSQHPKLPVIVDPVMVATSGARLLQPAAVRALRNELLPRASLITPNLDEAALLTGIALKEPEDLRAAARILRETFGCAALVKGGHLPGAEAIDLFWDGTEELLLAAPRTRISSTHGTGCSYSAAIAGYVALGCGLSQAVQMAKNHITQAIAQAVSVHGHPTLHPFWKS